MQELLIPTTTDSMFDTATSFLSNRSFLYNKDTGILYVKYNDEMRPIGSKVDYDNIILNINDEIALADDVHCKTLTVAPDDSGLVYKDNVIFAETSEEKRIVLLFKISNVNKVGTIGGKFYEKGDTVTSGINFSASISGSRSISQSTNGESIKYYKCMYNGESYLGMKFNPNTTVYFSGYEYINDSEKIDFEYTDDSFSSIAELKDEATKVSDDIKYDNVNNTNWDFTEYPAGLSSSNYQTTSNTEYDLTNGLVVSSDYSNTIDFYPTKTCEDDVGYISPEGGGKALKLTTSTKSAILKIYYSSNTSSERTLNVWDSNDNVIASGTSSSNSSISTLKVKVDSNSTYYIGSSSNKMRIYRICLIHDSGWDAFNYIWEFDSVPSDISFPTTGYDWGNGLTMINNGSSVEIHSTSTGYRFSSTASNLRGDKNTGYILVPSSENNIFSIVVPEDESILECLFCTSSNYSSRWLGIYDSDGNQLAIAWNVYDTPVSWSNNSGISSVSVSGLSAGTYYLKSSGDLKIWAVYLTNEGKTGTTSSIDEFTDGILGNLEETGEDGDAHHVTLQNYELTLSDLEKIASNLKDSDVQVYLDLHDCTVASDAKNWEGLFKNCTSLYYISLPQGVESLGVNTFTGCMFLKKIEFCDSITTFSCDSTNSIFSGARCRTYVLPKELSSISTNTFSYSGTRNVIVPPDSVNHFISMLNYGSFFNTLNYIKVYMTQEEYDSNTDGWELTWQHTNYFGCIEDDTIKAHIVIYSDLDALLEELNYGVE